MNTECWLNVESICTKLAILRYIDRDVCENCYREEIRLSRDNNSQDNQDRRVNGISIGLRITMTEREQLHAKFFNHEKTVVKDMDDSQLIAHREELAAIAFESRARLQAADDDLTERRKKLNPNQRQWIVSSDDPTLVSDAINSVKTKKASLTKADKLKAMLQSLGVENADDMIKNIKIKGEATPPMRDLRESFNRDKDREDSNTYQEEQKAAVEARKSFNSHLPKTLESPTTEDPKPFVNPFGK